MKEPNVNEHTAQTTAAKALRVNRDLERYGTFAEIGAGQEVARHFFQAGRASQTVAKTMSAYDMTYSDEIYGREKNGRYVCESRLLKMLEKEFSLLIRRLDAQRGAQTAFFALANTVATGTPETPRCHGWMGVRFQARPKGEPNDIVVHVRMRDRHRLQQQEALGILGVNLVEAAFYGLDDPVAFVSRLAENLKDGQVFIDVLKLSGPDLKKFDNKRMNLELVRRGLSEAVLLDPQGETLHASDAFYGKCLLIQRGAFNPVTISHVDIMEKGVAQMKGEVAKSEHARSEILPVLEIVLPRGTALEEMDDFERRVDLVSASGFHVLVSDFPLFYQLKHFIRTHTKAPMALVTGASKLAKIFDESAYGNLEGGLLEGLGKLFDAQTKLYVYPHKTETTCTTAKVFHPPGALAGIYTYFLKQGQITDISGCDEADVYWHSADVRGKIERGESGWEKLVPKGAASLLRSR